MNITVVYSTPTRRSRASKFADTDVDTVESAEEVARALEEKGNAVTLFPVDEDHIAEIKKIRADLIFNLIEWTGLDIPLVSKAFAALTKTGILMTGATFTNYITTADKVSMKKLFDTHALPTARWQVFVTGDETVRKDFRYPVIIKPSLEHCSIGLTRDAVVGSVVSLVRQVRVMIAKFRQPMVVEEFIAGREFQVTIIDTAKGLQVLPPAEIVFDTKSETNMLTYDSRWDDATTEYKTSHVAIANLTPSLANAIEDITKKTFVDLGFRDYARLDIRTRGSEIFILEANSNPGLSDDMEYGMTLSYKALGWTFADFIWKIVEFALRRPARERLSVAMAGGG